MPLILSPEAVKAPSEGETLRRSALRKLEQARTLLDSARSDMCNLEGEGYCDLWEKLGALDYDEFRNMVSKLRSMAPPTGVFHP